MYLSIINLDAPGQFLRLLLWIILPIGIFYLLVSSWLRYRRSGKAGGGLRLAVEGFSGYRGGNGGQTGSKDGYAGAGEEGYRVGYGVGSAATAEEVSEEEAGKETIYRGILWMKEKYEQYREQADKKYELLREELVRSEKRYQDLLLSIEQNKNVATDVARGSADAERGTEYVFGKPEDAERGLSERMDEEWSGSVDGGLAEVRGQLGAKQVIIEELEEQLRIERLKVEELVVKLQANGQLLLNIYQELDKSFNVTPT